jgi:Asp-tRNA(Asn)/Glu-tRNA(Gln) amidotransferase A subunit family amidase
MTCWSARRWPSHPSRWSSASPTEIAGEKLATYIDWMFLTFVITLVGCPALSLPCGPTAEGLPVGLQLVGRPHGDAELLGAALLLEHAAGGSLCAGKTQDRRWWATFDDLFEVAHWLYPR